MRRRIDQRKETACGGKAPLSLKGCRGDSSPAQSHSILANRAGCSSMMLTHEVDCSASANQATPIEVQVPSSMSCCTRVSTSHCKLASKAGGSWGTLSREHRWKMQCSFLGAVSTQAVRMAANDTRTKGDCRAKGTVQ